jgi:hypothetical protein
MKFALLGLVLALIALFVATAPESADVDASSPGTAAAPLVACPNLDGSPEGGVRVGDILEAVEGYFDDSPSASYVFLRDTNANGQGRVDDILLVVGQYFATCPAVDTEVAQATQWVLNDHPELLAESVSALSAQGYVGGGQDVPGQGKHYVKFPLWDGNFDLAAPEGLVYNNGRLAAQLYVVNGSAVGWQEDPLSATPGPCWDGIDNGSDGSTDASDGDCGSGTPSGSAPDDIDIDPLCNPSFTPCSWATNEGWHLHYYLCFVHIGTQYAQLTVIDPDTHTAPYSDDCEAFHNACPGCGGSWVYADRIGWMGHLWNWQPNANLVPDGTGMNGRFADCFPDAEGWKAYNCPQ